MKRLIVFLCLIFMLMPCSISRAFEDISDTQTQNAVETLTGYSILSGYEDGTFRPNNSITRAEFSKIIVATGNLYCMVENPIVFEDTADHWAKEYIDIARYNGIINGMSDTVFAPDEKLTNEQAVKMIVCMLGYAKNAQQSGGYPDGFMTTADTLGLLNGLNISGKAYATRGDVAVMIFRALDVPYLVTDENGNLLEDISADLTLRTIHEELLQFNNSDEYFDISDENSVG